MRSSKKLEQQRQREQAFDLSGIHQNKLPTYNALTDRNLCHHFEGQQVQSHLRSLGLVDAYGRLVDLDKQKSKLYIIEQEFKLAEQAERRREREEEEIRRRVQLKRHEVLQETKQKEKWMQLKEEKKITREIIQATKGYHSISKPTSITKPSPS